MKNRLSRRLWMLLVALLVVVSGLALLQSSSETVSLKILAINDLHGNLLPSSFRVPDPNDRTKTVAVQAGGIEALSTVVKNARASNPNTIFVGAGDLIGASPLVSALLRDEPTIEALSKMGMALSAVGNHEFDKGVKELLRIQNGGCDSVEPDKACKFGSYQGAQFSYIAANVFYKNGHRPLFKPYYLAFAGSVPVAFVGAVLKDTPTIVVPSGVAGIEFTDEAEEINKVARRLQAAGVQTIIAVIHQGGTSRDFFDVTDCSTLSGPIVDIVKKLDKSVDVVISGHSHRGYRCRVDGRLVTQSDAYGHLLTEINLTIDKKTKDVVAVTSNSIVVDPSKVAKDPAMTEIVQRAKALTDPVANQPIAKLAGEQITTDTSPAGESFLGDVIADAQLWASQPADKGGAQIAFMNPGGIRAPLPPNPSPSKSVSYGDTFTVQPFGNSLVVMTLTGAQIKLLLEQQWLNQSRPRILQVSQGFSYTWDGSKQPSDKVVAGSMMLNGQPIQADKNYRVVVNSFLADGGDNFLVLKEGKDRLGGEVDLDALQAYLKAMEAAGKPVGPGPRDRIKVVNP